MNQLAIRLSNEALARGAALARARGLDSIEELLQDLLLTAAMPALDPSSSEHTRAETKEEGQPRNALAAAPPTFAVNPPRLDLKRPAAAPRAELAVQIPARPAPLPFLTNRLAPLKASTRALANLAIREDEWPRLSDFQAKAGHAARDRGLALLAEDRAAGRRGREKRSVAWPIGENPVAALERYVFAFTLTEDAGSGSGPLATLGLAVVADGRAVLTELGCQLAMAVSPILDGGSGALSEEEIAILREALRGSAPERDAVAEFLGAVRRAAGSQPRVDELLATWHRDWSADQAAAQRAAMIGRLSELAVVEVIGRGTKAAVSIVDDVFASEFEERNAA